MFKTFACLLIATPLAAATRATVPDPVLDPLIAAAVEQSPELVSARAEAEAARRRISPASTLPDPSASVSYDGDRQMTTIAVSQPLPWPGKRDIATRAAEHEALATQNTLVGRATLAIESRLRTAWYELAAARSTRALVDDRAVVAKELEEAARQRYAAGLGIQQDVIRAQAEIARLDEQRAQLDAVVAARSNEVQRLSVAANVDRAALPAPEGGPSFDEVIASVVARSPELQAAQHAVDAASFRVDEAQKNRKPDFVVSAGPMIGPMGNAITAGVGMSLPIHGDKRQGAQVAEAEAILQARRADAVALQRDLEIRTRERFASLEAAQKTAALYRDRIVPLDQLALDSALASYRAGKTPANTVLDSLNVLFNDRATLVARIAEAAKWRVVIDEANVEATSIATAPVQQTGSRPGAMPSM